MGSSSPWVALLHLDINDEVIHHLRIADNDDVNEYFTATIIDCKNELEKQGFEVFELGNSYLVYEQGVYLVAWEYDLQD